jgi:Ribonuclease G/E
MKIYCDTCSGLGYVIIHNIDCISESKECPHCHKRGYVIDNEYNKLIEIGKIVERFIEEERVIYDLSDYGYQFEEINNIDDLLKWGEENK